MIVGVPRAGIKKFDLAQSRTAHLVQNSLRGKTVRVVRWLTLRALDRTGNRYGQGRIYFTLGVQIGAPDRLVQNNPLGNCLLRLSR